MKRNALYMLAFIAMLAFTLPACKKDKHSKPTAKQLIVGKWFMTNAVNDDGTPTTVDDCTKKSFFQFEADGILIIETYKHNGSNCTVQSTVAVQYSISDDNNTLIVTQGSTTHAEDIQALTKSHLTIYFADAGHTIYFEKKK